jgi:hypothetical protein
MLVNESAALPLYDTSNQTEELSLVLRIVQCLMVTFGLGA